MRGRKVGEVTEYEQRGSREMRGNEWMGSERKGSRGSIERGSKVIEWK